jgi:hypothetical protein
MNRLLRAAIGPAALLVVNLTTYAVVMSNQRSGLYSPDADSLAIPIGMTTLASISSLLLLAILAGSRRVMARANCNTLAMRLAGAVLACAYTLLVFIALAGLVYWFVPHHYPIACSYALLLAWLGWEARDDVRRLRTPATAA